MPTDALSRIPTEMLTHCLSHLAPYDLQTLLSVSRILRGAASQDTLWESHCETVYNKGSSEIFGWRKIHKPDLLHGSINESNLSYHLIWRRLHLFEGYLGWWLSLDETPAGIVMHIRLNNDTLVISHSIPKTDGPAFRGAGGHIFALSWNNNVQNPLLIDSEPIVIEQYSVITIRWLIDGPSKIMYNKRGLHTFYASNNPPSATGSQPLPGPRALEAQPALYYWPFHQSPSLFDAICHSGVSFDAQGHAVATGVPAVSFPRPPGTRHFVALRSPVETPSSAALIEDGTWVASYGQAHGCEFIHIQIRTITGADLNHPWGVEQNLASAFSPRVRDIQDLFSLPGIPPSDVTPEHVRVGCRIIEAVKITGDVNVPRGVRTFVGFLDHESSWSGVRHDEEFVARPASHPWPMHPDPTVQRETPAAALPTSLTEMREQDVPARGMTMPGIMRVSDTGFLDPKWANAVIHITNRQEIRVMLQDGHHVTAFYKVRKDMFECIR